MFQIVNGVSDIVRFNFFDWWKFTNMDELHNYSGRQGQTRCNLKKHMQTDKTQANQENIHLKTDARHLGNVLQIHKRATKYTQHNQIHKRSAKTRNTTKYDNVLQMVVSGFASSWPGFDSQLMQVVCTFLLYKSVW